MNNVDISTLDKDTLFIRVFLKVIQIGDKNGFWSVMTDGNWAYVPFEEKG